MARKKKYDELTPRQRQSQQIMRAKSAMKKRRAIVRKVTIIGGSAAFALLTGGGIWAWKSGAGERALQHASDAVYAYTVRAGFGVQSLYLEGRSRTSMEDIDNAIGIKKGDPILRISLSDVRERLEKIESVKQAAVERALPGAIYIRIVEREPAALWQHHGKIVLVDDNGVVMSDIDAGPYKSLPLIIGDHAPEHVKELMGILALEPELAKRFSSATRISDRRWNIRLNTGANTATGNNVEVRLPELHPEQAWKKLAEAETKQQLLDRDVKVIDLRLEGKMFIKLAPEEMRAKDSSARET